MFFRVLIGLSVLAVASQGQTSKDTSVAAIEGQIAKYAAAVDGADTKLAAEVWSTSDDVSFIHPQGHEHGWEQVKDFYLNSMGVPFSRRKLTVRDVKIHVMGDVAWAEFYWHFTATLRSDGSPLNTDGRETQIYRKTAAQRWELVHVHYSALPVTPGGP